MTAEQYPAPLVPAEVDPKRVANLVARAALAGWVVTQAPDHTIADGSFAAERWGQIRFLRDIDEAERWLAKVSGKAAA